MQPYLPTVGSAKASSLACWRSNLPENFVCCVSHGGCFMLICSRRQSGSTLQVRLARSLALLILLLAAASGQALAASIAFVQSNSATPQSPQTTVTVTYTAAQTLGNLNVVVVGWNDTTSTVSSVTDSLGNAYVLAAGPIVQSGTASQAIYYGKNISAAAAGANSVIVTFSLAASFPDIRIAEYSGLDTVSPLDVSAGTQGTTTSTSNSGSVTTSGANDLLVGANLVQATTTGAGAGYTSRGITGDGDILEDRVVSATGSYNATAALDKIQSWIMQMVAFRAAGSSNPAPSITSLSPATGPVGTSVTITGANFGASQGSSTVAFNGTTATPTAWGATSITAQVPTGATTGSVVVTVNLQPSNGVNFTVGAVSPIVFIQTNSASPQATQTPVTVTYTNAQTAGTLNVVVVSWNDSTATISSVTDSIGNTYAVAAAPVVQSATASQAIYYAKNIAAAAAGANTVTVNFNVAARHADIRIAEYGGVDPLNPLDTSVGAQGNTATSDSGAVATTNTNDLLIGANVVQSTSTGPGTGYTSRGITVDGDILEDQVVFATGSYNATAVLDKVQLWIMQLAAFRAATSGGSPVPNIASLNPTTGPAGTSVTITGSNFGTSQGTSTVRFNGTTATATNWSANSIVAPVPVGATSGSVVVTVGGVASNSVTFIVTPTPSISSLNPSSGPVGASLTITGANFGVSQGSSTVTFNGTSASPTSWTATSIIVPVPTGATTGNVVVTVGGLPSNGIFFSVTSTAPSITSLNPTSGAVSTSVTIAGTNFGASQGTSTVTFNGTTGTPTAWSATSITVPVPTGATTGNVVITAGGVASNGINFTVTTPPTITSLTPASGPVGTSVTIAGTNFGATQGNSTINFNGISAIPTSWSASSIVVSVPAGATTGNVVVTVGGQASNGSNFTLTTSTAGIALVQHRSKDAGVTASSTLAFNLNNSSGNWIAVVIRAGKAGQVFTVSDTRGNTYLKAIQFNVTTDTPNGDTLGIFYAENIAGGANTVTVVESINGNTLRFAILEYSGVAPANSLDVVSTAQGTSATANSSSVLTTANGELLLGAILTGNAATFTAATGYAIEERVPASPNTKLATEDQIQATAGTVSAGVTFGSSDSWGAGLAAFKAASGGGTTAPAISSLNPTAGPVGASVTIGGTNFAASQGASTVTFNGIAATPTSWSATSIAVPVPTGATTGNVVVTVGGVASNGVTFTVTVPPPSITSLNPTSGLVGATVTIAGTNFGASQGISTVKFNGTTASPTSWSATSIAVAVPAGATTGNVVVTVGG